MTNIHPKSKELRVVLTPEAYERIKLQAAALDQTPASFARQVIMEKVVALEAAGSQGGAVALLTKMMLQAGQSMED